MYIDKLIARLVVLQRQLSKDLNQEIICRVTEDQQYIEIEFPNKKTIKVIIVWDPNDFEDEEEDLVIDALMDVLKNEVIEGAKEKGVLELYSRVIGDDEYYEISPYGKRIYPKWN